MARETAICVLFTALGAVLGVAFASLCAIDSTWGCWGRCFCEIVMARETAICVLFTILGAVWGVVFLKLPWHGKPQSVCYLQHVGLFGALIL